MKREKPKEKGPQIKRDANNMLDKNHAEEVSNKLVKELIETERDFQKDNAMKHAMTDRRDIIVKTIIYMRNTVDGHLIESDSQNPLYEKLNDHPLDPLRYRYIEHIDGELFVRDMPMAMSSVGKWTMGMFKCVVNYLCKMGVFNRT